MISFWMIVLFGLVCLAVEGFFSGSEIAILSADRLKLRSLAERGHRGAQAALKLADHPELLLSTTLLMVSFCVVALSAAIEIFFHQRFQDGSSWIAVSVASPLIVIFGEFLPKTYFQKHSDRFSSRVAPTVLLFHRLLGPFTFGLTRLSGRLSTLATPLRDLVSGRKRTTRDELVTALNYRKGDSELKSSERQMIRRILDFKDTEAKSALIPLVKVDAIPSHSDVHQALTLFQRSGHSRCPVYTERVDNIVGILDVYDLHQSSRPEELIHSFVRPARFVAETQALSDVLAEMQREHIEMAVVVDEHGGAVGVLTLEDIVEEIVGEIRDEYDSASFDFKVQGPNRWLVQAQTEIVRANEGMHLDLPEGQYETLAGFLLQQFGRIPIKGDELFYSTSAGRIHFLIQEASPKRISLVQIKLEASGLTGEK